MTSRSRASSRVDASGSRLRSDQLARDTGTSTDFIDRLVEAGAIAPDEAGTYDAGDILRVRLAHTFELSGVHPDTLAFAMGIGLLPLDWLVRVWPPPPSTSRSYAEFAVSLGERASLLPQVYVALGLAEPSPDTMMRLDEEKAITEFIEVWSIVDDRLEVYLRAARIAGEGMRRIQEATLDLFDASGGSPPQRLARGLSTEDAMLPTVRMNPMMTNLLVWLLARHSEHEVFGRIVAYVERTLVEAGRIERPPTQPAAIAFVDLARYTEITQKAGDEQAAAYATDLQALATAAARRHRGRVVKLLGDGVMLRFPSVQSAVESVTELMREIVDAGMPPAHAGIAAGPIVVRDGDVYGHTVNLAARIAGSAGAGELLLDAGAADYVATAGVDLEPVGEVKLKGVAQPVALVRVVAARRDLSEGRAPRPGRR